MADRYPTATGAKGRSVILVISDRPHFPAIVRSSLSAVQDYEVAEITGQAALGGSALRTNFDLVVLDLADGGILQADRLSELRRGLGVAPLIAVSEGLLPEHMRRLVQLNAADWLQMPLGGRALLDAVADQLHGSRIRKSDVFAFLPCSGGVGATSLAIIAAAHIASRGQAFSTCLVDLDFAAGACGRYLDIENEFNIDGVIKTPDRIDLELLDIVKREHPAGFSLLSFRRPDLQIADFGDAFIFRLLDIVTYRYQMVVLDLPSYPTPWAPQVLANSDHVIVVSERTVPGLKNAHEAHERLIARGNLPSKLTLLLNKDRRRMFSVSISHREVQKLFKTSQTVILPDNWPLMSEALNRGIPANSVHKRTTLVKRLGQLLDDMVRKEPRR